MLRPARRAQAQSFDRVAQDYDRLAQLDARGLVGPCLAGLLPPEAVRRTYARQIRHFQPNISYRQADLHDVHGVGQYGFVLSVLTLHHVPDLHAALSHVKTLLAPGGRLVVIDMYSCEAATGSERLLRTVERAVPLRLRLHGLAMRNLGANLASRGPATAWEIYRLSTRRAWLDHRVTDRFFSRLELERSGRITSTSSMTSVSGLWNSGFAAVLGRQNDLCHQMTADAKLAGYVRGTQPLLVVKECEPFL